MATIMNRLVRGLAAVLGAGLVAACGGGGGNAGTPLFGGGSGGGSGGGGSSTPSMPTAASVEVVSSASTVGTAGEQVTITAIVKGAGNVTLASQPVAFEASTGVLSSYSTTTDASGVATAKFSAGTSSAAKANRNASITVRSGTAASGSVDIAITGTTLAYSGPTTLQFGTTATLGVKLTDSAGAALAGQAVAVTSSAGNGLSTAAPVTDAQGNATLVLTASQPGADTLTFSAVGATRAVPISVSGEDFSLSTSATGATAGVNTAVAVTALYRLRGLPAAGPYAVRFAATAGTVTPADAATGRALTNGQASVSVTSSFAGPVTVQATLVNTTTQAILAQATVPLQFVGLTPAAVALQVSPSSLSPNPAGTTANQARVRAVVTDSAGNAVKGAVVNFAKDADASGGNLSQASASTDENGQATVQYIAGPLSTATNGVQLRATVAGSSVTAATTLTVNQSSLFIALGTGNTISNSPSTDTRYRKTWTLYVTDASGAPVPNQQVSVSVLPTRYRKGSFTLGVVDYGTAPWDQLTLTGSGELPAGQYITCANEDVDYNGIITAGKDVNGSGRLEPGNVITVNGGANVTTVTTDAAGFALVNLEYAESYAYWVEVVLKASALVAGTESSNQAVFWATGMKSDYTVDGGPPAGLISPFGVMPSCFSPR